MTRKRIIAISALLILLAFWAIIPNAMALATVPANGSNQKPIALPTQSQTGPHKAVEEIPLISEQGYQDYLAKIDKSNLTKKEKSYYRELLKQTRDNKSSLSKEEQVIHIIDIAYIDHPEDLKQDKKISELKSDLENITKSKSSKDNISTNDLTEKPVLQWSGFPRGDNGWAWSYTGSYVGDVHNYMGYEAGKFALNDPDNYWSDRLGKEAADPDKQTLPIPYIHQYNHYVVMGSPALASACASDAGDAYRVWQPNTWVTSLAWSMHYESDAATPFHYNFDYLYLHSAYEDWVGSMWTSEWKTTIDNDQSYYNIYSPYDGAINLGNEGHQRLVNIIAPIMQANPNSWRSDPSIKSETYHMLLEAQRHNRGLVFYCCPV